MKAIEAPCPLSMPGIVCIDKWNKKGDVTGLSLISESGEEYRILFNDTAKRLSKCVWDEVEVEFLFVKGLHGEPWIDVVHFKYEKQPMSSLQSQKLDEVQFDLENKYDLEHEKEDWRFDINSFVDRLEDVRTA